MKKLSLLCALLLTAGAFAQPTYIQQTPDQSLDIIRDIELMANGDVTMIPGSTFSLQYSLLRIDGQGDTVWSKKPLDMVPPNASEMWSLEESDDGSIYTVSSGFNNRMAFWKFDANGNNIWATELSHPGWSPNVGGVRTISDGNDLIYVRGNGFSGKTLYIGKINDLGTEVFHTEIDMNPIAPLSSDLYNRPLDIIETGDGNFVLIGGFYGNNGDPDKRYMLKFTNTGTVLWFKEIGNQALSNSASPGDIYEATNGDLIFSGTAQIGPVSGTGVMRFDANGNFIWGKQIEDGASGSVFTQELTNGNIALVTANTAISVDAISRTGLYVVDNTGGFVWARTYGKSGTNAPYMLHEDGSQNIITIGTGGGFPQSVEYLRTDANGSLAGCMAVIDTLNIVNWNPTIANITISQISSSTTVFADGVSFNTAVVYTKNTPGLMTSALINEPPCFGDNGSIDLSISGGTIPYGYYWSNGTTNQDLTNVPAGEYYLWTLDATGCANYDTLVLSEPTALSASFTSTDVDCFGAQNGSIDVTPAGGTPGYTYAWSTTATTEDLTGLGGGFYQLTLTDANGCDYILGVGVNEPQQLIAAIASTDNVNCFGNCDGQIASFGAGGVAPYTYLWNDPLTQTNDTATGLCAGNYLLTVTDANGCNAYANAGIAEPAQLSNMTMTWAADCFSNNGSAMANTNGGTAPYQYNWDGAGFVSDDSLGGFGVGTYTLDVTDANGCSLSETFTIESITTPVEMCVVTVNDQNQNVIVWEKPVASNIAGFNIYRNVAGVYTPVGYTAYDSLSQYVDTDFGIDPNITSYRYKIAVLDSCGNESDLSDYHETIHLTSNLGVGGEVNLIWDNYEGFPFGEYRILRDTTGQGNWHLLNTVLSSNFTYTDFNVPTSAPSVNYVIEVVMPDTCTATAKAQDYNSSRSNNINGVGDDPGGNGAGYGEFVLSQAKVYPNPTNQAFTIELPTAGWTYEILDVSGRVVFGNTASDEQSKTLDISFLTDGVYLLRLSFEESSTIVRVLKN